MALSLLLSRRVRDLQAAVLATNSLEHPMCSSGPVGCKETGFVLEYYIPTIHILLRLRRLTHVRLWDTITRDNHFENDGG